MRPPARSKRRWQLSEETKNNVMERLAAFVVGYDPALAPAEVLDAAKVLVLDGLGCLVAGVDHPACRILLRYAEDLGGNEHCLLAGSPNRTNAPLAAFVHGAMLHVNDFEIQGAVPAHGTSNLLPPALALAETQGSTGLEVLGAIIAGWEVQARVRAGGPRHLRAFHPPGVVGPLGATAVSGKLLGLSVAELTMAFGIVASRACGLPANAGTMVKSTHPGNAGRMGVESALLARAGFTSNPDIFWARQGFVTAFFDGAFDEELALGNIDGRNLVDPGFTIKPYPAEVYMQRIIEAAQGVRAQVGFDPALVEHVVVELAKVRADLSRPAPASGLDGKFSYEYCAAVGLCEERVTVRSFSDEVRFSPAIEAMLPKIEPAAAPGIPEGVYETWVVVRAAMRDGSVLESTCGAFNGSLPRPMSRADRLAKFADCVGQRWDPDQAAAAVSAVENLEADGALTEILELLHGIRSAEPAAAGTVR
jgi:2-methylcitrate dehydratase PrpD